MQLYRIFDADGSDRPNRWKGTMADAQEVMKQTNPQFRCEVQIDLCEVPADKTNVLAMLDGQKIELEVVKSWRGTARGGVRLLE